MRGLPNLGATCYFNTAVQCLAHVPYLTNTLLRKPYEGQCELTREFSRLVYNLWAEDGNPDPRGLLLAFRTRFPSFDPGQHDAQEAFLCLVDALENSLGKEFIKKIFTGRETQVTEWPGGKSERTEDFVSVVFSLNEPCEVTLEGLMKTREKPVEISGYKDDAGAEHNARIQTRVTEWPQIATFTFACYTGHKPIIILPDEFAGRKLFGAVLHVGGPNGGHYALAVRHGDQWYIKDDGSVSKMDSGPRRGPFYMALYRLQNS
jgi:Ubiquitin carboxyl-terminal hydrolase